MSCIRLCLIISTMILLVSCNSANRTSIFRTFSVDDAKSVTIDAYQRAIISSTKIDGGDGSVHVVYCAEPSPDAFSSFTSSVGFNIMKSDLSNETSVKFIQELIATASDALSTRTAAIQLLRDGLYRACEAHAAGALDAIQYARMLRHYQDMTLALLSIELLTKINHPRNKEEIGLSHESISEITEATESMVESVLRKQTDLEILIGYCFSPERPLSVLCERITKQILARLDSSESTRLSDPELQALSTFSQELSDFGSDDKKQIPTQFYFMDIGKSRTHGVNFEEGTISKWIKFEISEKQEYKIYTATTIAETDPAIVLYKQQDGEIYLEELEKNDDSDMDLNAVINITLDKGTYFLNVYDFSLFGGDGEYEIHIVTSDL